MQMASDWVLREEKRSRRKKGRKRKKK